MNFVVVEPVGAVGGFGFDGFMPYRMFINGFYFIIS